MTSAERWAKVQRVVEASLELPPEARAAFIGMESGNDPGLREEIDRLERACVAAQNAEGFLTDPAVVFAAPVVAEVAALEAGSGMGDVALAALKESLADRYLIERELGRGGMATVYLAHDHRHGRRVALKVMHPGRLASVSAERFLREIRLSASLTHPHILPLHDSGDANGVLFYVMPYIEGDSLRTRIAREGALAVAEALSLVRETASALDYAHRHGIVHRDIKPENILLLDGHAVVADFGIARALAHALPTREGSELGLDTITDAGVRPGTPAYMAPEQVAGNPGLDARADLYALGMLAYETLCGAHPFAGRTPEGLLAAQLTELPVPLADQRPEVPRALSNLVERLLAKDPGARPPSAEAVLAELEPISMTPSGGVPRVAPEKTAGLPGVKRRLPGWVIVATPGVIVVAGAVALLLRTAPPPTYEQGHNTQVTLEPGPEISPTLSPDGSVVAYLAGRVNRTRIYTRSVAGGAAVEVGGGLECNPRYPQWSPDGTQILFDCGGAIYTAPFPGGTARVEVGRPGGGLTNAAWSPDGQRIVYVEAREHLLIQDRASGISKRLAAGNDLHSPAWSHDGRWIAAISGNSGGPYNRAPSTLVLISAGGGRFEKISDSLFMHLSPVWAPEDRGLFLVSSEGGVRDIYFLALNRQHRPAGPARRLTTGLRAGSVSLSWDGKRMTYAVYSRNATIWSVSLSGRKPATLGDATRLTTTSQDIVGIAVSADGLWLTFDSDRSGNADIWKMPVAGGEPTRLTSDPGDKFNPTWSPDGRWIAFHSWRNGNRDLFMVSSQGGHPQQITTDTTHELVPKWSPDGKRLAFYSTHPLGGRFVINTLTRLGDSTWGALRQIADSGQTPNWSPDSRWLGYLSLRSGIRVVPADGGESRVVQGPFQFEGQRMDLTAPMWSEDGRELFFNSNDASGWKVFSVPVTGGAPSLRLRVDGVEPVTGGSTFLRADRLYFVLALQESDVYVVDLARVR